MKASLFSKGDKIAAYDEAQMSFAQYESWQAQDTVNEINRADIDYLLMITED